MSIDFSKYDKVLIRLTKVRDTKFEGNHPNGINEGYVKEGIINVEKSNEHQCFLLIEGDRFWNTSHVIALNEYEGYDLATTLNSVYKIEPMLTAIPGVQEKHSVNVEESK
jgi:hypothetical protein